MTLSSLPIHSAGLMLAVALFALCDTAQAQLNTRAPMGSAAQPPGGKSGTLQIAGSQTVRLQQVQKFSDTPFKGKLPIPGNPSYEKTVDGHKVKTRLLLSPLQNAMRQGVSADSGIQRKEGAPTHENGLVCSL